MAVLLWGACQEDLTAPGACPEFCPSTRITVVDTLIRTGIVRDSAFRGYVKAFRGTRLQLAREDTGATSWAVLRFPAFSERIVLVSGDTIGEEVVAIDSFRLQLTINRRTAVEGMELALFRLPASLDSTVALADVQPFLDDSTLITTIAVDDTTESGDQMRVLLPGDAFPTFDADGRVTAIGVELRSPTPTFMSLGSLGGGQPGLLTRFVQVDSAGAEIVFRDEARQANFTTYVFAPPPDLAPDELTVGGAPSARSIIRVALPSAIVDSSNVVRATLILVPTRPVTGAPQDSLNVQTEALSADFGPKSPIIPTLVPNRGNARLPTGWSDTVQIDITHIITSWKNNERAPRSFVIRVTPEASSFGEFRFSSSRMPDVRPALQITYVPALQP